MSNDNLSQEEINALLADMRPGISETGYSPSFQADSLRDRLTVVLASGGEALSGLFGSQVVLAVTDLRTEAAGRVIPGLEPSVGVRADFTQGLSGSAYFLFPEAHALQLARILLGDDSVEEMGPLPESSLGEAVGQLLGAGMAKLSEELATAITFAPPEVIGAAKAQNALGSAFPPEAHLVLMSIRLEVDQKLNSNLTVLLDVALAEGLAAPNPAVIPDVSAQAKRGDPLPEPPPVRPAATRLPQAAPVAVRPAEWKNLGGGGNSAEAHNIELLLDVPLQITVELGRSRRKIRDVLAMGPGSVVELDRLAGEPVDVLVNGKLIAKGEVVVIDDNFGVRITDIVSPAERVRNL